MHRVEQLRDGTLRLSGRSCILLHKRIRPALVLTAIRGRDDGEFGTIPVELIEREHERFRRPVDWFINANQAINASPDVFSLWTDWLARNRHRLRSVHVLASQAALQLTLSIAQHLSKNKSMTLYNQPAPFETALRTLGARETSIPQARFDEPPDAIRRTSRLVACSSYSAAFERFQGPLMLVTIAGEDCGQLTSDILDRVKHVIDVATAPLTLMLDVRNVSIVGSTVPDEWALWMEAHRAELERVAVLAPSGVLPLVLGMVRFRAPLGDLLQIFKDTDEFVEVGRRIDPKFHLAT